MPLRGENIGTAFVRVLVNGDGFDRSVRDMMDDSDETFAKGGEEHGESYNDAFTRKLREGLADIGDDVEGLEKKNNRAAASIKGLITRYTNEGKKSVAELDNALTDHRKNVRDLTEDIDKLTDSMGEVGKTRKVWTSLRNLTLDFRLGILRTKDELGTGFDKSLTKIRSGLTRTSKTMDEFGSNAATRFGNYRKEIEKSRKVTDSLAKSIGKAFGKGGRNDFVNIVGILTGAVFKLSGVFTSLIQGLPGLSNAFGGSGGGKFINTLFSVATGFIGIAVSIGALIIVIGAATSLISGLVGILIALGSVLSGGLIGAIAAVGGALIPLAAGIGVVALAVKNLSKEQIAALKPVKEAFGELGDTAAEAFGPHLTGNADEFVDILNNMNPVVKRVGDNMGKVLDDFIKDLDNPAWQKFGDRMENFLPRAVKRLGGSATNALGGISGVFRALIPLIDRFLVWLTDVTDKFNEWANSKGGQKTLREFFKNVGDDAAALGDFLTSAADALGELFAAGEGPGRDMLNSITGALDKFVTWAQSKEGQKSLEDFFVFAGKVFDKIGDISENLLKLWDDLDDPQARDTMLQILDILNSIIGAMDWIARHVSTFGFLTNVLTPKSIDWKKLLPTASVITGMIAPFTSLGSRIGKAIGSIPWGKMFSGIGGAITSAIGGFGSFGSRVLSKIGKINWRSVFINTTSVIQFLVNPFGRFASLIISKMGHIDWKGVFATPASVMAFLSSPFTALAGMVIRKIGTIKWSSAFDNPVGDILNMFDGLAAKIVSAVGNISFSASIDWPTPPSWLSKITGRSATGGVFWGAQARIIGEEGPEAVVPLRRPLSMVDPAVRELSAFAQGIPNPGLVTRGAAQTVVDVGGISIITPTRDPAAVAQEVVNRLVATGY
jgi:hypothetical protein